MSKYYGKMAVAGKKGEHIAMTGERKGNVNLYAPTAPIFGDGCALILSEDVRKGDHLEWDCKGSQRSTEVKTR